jgi:beta-glucanase (GH16 family)
MHLSVSRRLGAVLAVLTMLAWSGLAGLPAVAASQQWQLVAQDNFTGPLAPHWSVYQGSPACCQATTWATSQVTEKDGRLVLSSVKQDGQWITGGISAAGWPAMVRTYGKYVARVRVDRGAGISAVALLWPKSNVWPPEIDYYELSGLDADRTQETQTVHRGPNDAKLRSVYQGDLTQWHTVSVEWLPNSISYFVDNRLTGRVTNTAYIPHQPMWPAFQMQIQQNAAGQSIATATGPVRMYVNWFAVYAPVSPTPAAPPATSSGSVLWTVLAVLAVVVVVLFGWILIVRLLRSRSRRRW